MTKKGIFKYLMLTVFFGCMLMGIGTVSVNAASSSGQKNISCFDSSSWRNTVASAPDSGSVRKTRVSCNSSLAEATAYLEYRNGTIAYKGTTSTLRTATVEVTLLTNVTHKHYYKAYYG